jgi:hypothetical protein
MDDKENLHSVNLPVGEWVDVPKGMVAAPDTYVDEHGVLRSSGDNSCVVWHVPQCDKRGIQAEDIIYDSANAPWCPDCYMSFEAKREAIREKEKIESLFGTAGSLDFVRAPYPPCDSACGPEKHIDGCSQNQFLDNPTDTESF